MQCRGLRRNCKTCGAHYDKGGMVETCTQCGADMHCERDAMRGYYYCPKHGGPQPQFGFYGLGRAPVTGDGSKYPLVKLASKYTELERDGRFLSNRHSMAIIWRRIEQLAEKIDVNEAPDRVKNLYQLWSKFRDLDAAGKRVEATAVKAELDAEFDKAYHEYASWSQMFEALDLQRKMTESEVKIAKDLKAIMTAEDGMELVAQLLAIVIQVENDGTKLKRIIYEFRKLVGDDVEERAYSRAGGRGGETIDA